MPDHIKKYVSSHGIEQTNFNSIEEAVEVADVLYVTRLNSQLICVNTSQLFNHLHIF